MVNTKKTDYPGVQEGETFADGSCLLQSRALVVDDDKVMVQLVCSMLRRIGFDVDTTDNGHDAKAMIELRRYDLVVTDLIMPNVNGYELANLIKQMYSETMVVMITGLSRKEARSKGMYPGPMDGWLFKPFSYWELKDLITLIIPCERKSAL